MQEKIQKYTAKTLNSVNFCIIYSVGLANWRLKSEKEYLEKREFVKNWDERG